MRGGGSVFLALFLGAAIASLLYSCAFVTPPYFHVPYCSTLSSCLRRTGMEDSPYAREVARVWHYVNKFRNALEAREKLCQLDLNVERLDREISAALQTGGMYLAYAVRHADTANLIALSSISLAVEELEDLGVSCVPDATIHDVYEEMWDTLAGLERWKDTTRLAGRFIVAYSMHRDLERLGLASEAVVAKIPLVGAVLRWALMTMSEISTGGSAYFNAEKYINRSVGLYGSVFAAYRALWESYLEAVREMESAARDAEKRKREALREVEEKIRTLRSYSLQGLSWDRVAKIAPRRAVGALLVADLEDLADRARIDAERYAHFVERNLSAYWMGRRGAYCSLSSALDALRKLEGVSGELDRYIDALDDLRRSCLEYVKSARPSSAYVRNRIKGLLKELEGGDLGACGDALALLELDANYRTTEALLAFCESRAERYADYNCAGDPGERLDCCMTFLKRKRAELLASEQYRRYAALRSAVGKLLALVGDEDSYAEFFAIPAYPEDEKELSSAVNRLVRLYRKLKREAERLVQPAVSYEGYLDGEQMSELNIVFSVPVSGADLSFRVDLPFEVYAYRVLEGNGLHVSISGSRAHLRGSGWAKVLALAYPAKFDVERMGEADGEIYVRIAYDGFVPARYPLRGRVVSKSPSVRVSGGYLYFHRPGEAVVAVAAIEQEWEEEGNRIRILLRNTAQEPYTGTVFLPISAEKIPRACQPFGDGVVCSLRLDPFEERVFTFSGVRAKTAVREALPEPREATAAPPSAGRAPPDKNSLFSLLEILRGWYKRARDLGVAQYLSFDGNILSNLEKHIRETNDESVISTYAALLNSMVSGTKRYVRARVASLKGKAGAEKAYALARQALQAKDYMLALALAVAVDSVEDDATLPLFPLILSSAGLVIIGVYARLRGRRVRVRRIPKV